MDASPRQTHPTPVHLSPAEAERDRLFHLSLDLLCIAGLDGYFKQVNPSWTRALGWSREELLSRPVADFMHPDDRERTLLARAALARGIPLRDFENRYLCKDGSFRWLSWQSSIEPNASTVFAVARDITEQKRRDHDRLILSKLESTGVLAGGIAHDFNNLLASLQLSLELIRFSGATNERQKQFLAQSLSIVHSAQSLTQKLLTFTEGGVDDRKVIGLQSLLQEAMDIALSGSAIRGETLISSDLHPASVDEAQISQVVRNLVLNACESMPNGGTVRLSAENQRVSGGSPGDELPAGDYLRISVTDEGAGIAEDVLPKVFDPYFSTKKRGHEKGMGLGLTICRTIIKKHGGSMTVDSVPGQGTTVCCHLPAVPAALHVSVGSTAPVPKRAASGQRILVMDDEASLLEMVSQTLLFLGYAVETARDGEEAVSLYQRALANGTPFAAVLLDLTVRGGMGGAETIQRMLADDPDVRGVLMTGYDQAQTFRDYANHGFKYALSKPFSMDRLRAALAEVIGATA